MITLHKTIATFFGIGYLGKGGGTVAAIALCLIWIIVPWDKQSAFLQIIILLLVFAVGVWSGNVVDSIWGKDSNKVVIDEVAGMMTTLLLIPATPTYLCVGLLLFRFFDIAKPLGIKKMEVLHGGWGVMADDLLAGVYSRLVLGIIIHFRLL